jgi:hypothetical protein
MDKLPPIAQIVIGLLMLAAGIYFAVTLARRPPNSN